jgi:hypothetical protein
MRRTFSTMLRTTLTTACPDISKALITHHAP